MLLDFMQDPCWQHFSFLACCQLTSERGTCQRQLFTRRLAFENGQAEPSMNCCESSELPAVDALLIVVCMHVQCAYMHLYVLYVRMRECFVLLCRKRALRDE